jgi:hypothetical protein
MSKKVDLQEFEEYRKRILDISEFFGLRDKGIEAVNKAIDKKKASETRTTKVLEANPN